MERSIFSGIIRIAIAVTALVGILILGTSLPLWVAVSSGFCIGTTIGYGLMQLIGTTES
jgi:hypothetical protein